MKKFFFRLKMLWRLKSLKEMLRVLETREDTMHPFEYQYEHGFLVDAIKRLEDGDIRVFEELKIFGYN